MSFKVVHITRIKQEDVKEPGFEEVKVRWLITEEDGAENFAMRCFEIMPGGRSAHHAHNWEHEAFVLDGQGLVVCNDKERRIGRGYVVFVPPNAPHHFENLGDRKLRFLCLVPYRK